MLRLSVTDLESWRFLKANDEATPEQILARLRHQEPPTPQMEAGRAFAKLFEGARPGSMDVVKVDGWTFDFSAMTGEIALPRIRELKGELVIQTPSGPVTLVGKVDGLDALIVHDQKLTERWEAERYTESVQWRAYLVMFGARAFTYDVFLGKYDFDDRRVTVSEYHPFTFYAYPQIREDVEEAVAELAAVIDRHMPERRTA